MSDFPCCEADIPGSAASIAALTRDHAANLAVARSASQQVRDDTIRAECAQLREDNAHLRAKLEISQLALDHAITALGRTANRSQSPENSRRQA